MSLDAFYDDPETEPPKSWKALTDQVIDLWFGDDGMAIPDPSCDAEWERMLDDIAREVMRDFALHDEWLQAREQKPVSRQEFYTEKISAYAEGILEKKHAERQSIFTSALDITFAEAPNNGQPETYDTEEPVLDAILLDEPAREPVPVPVEAPAQQQPESPSRRSKILRISAATVGAVLLALGMTLSSPPTDRSEHVPTPAKKPEPPPAHKKAWLEALPARPSDKRTLLEQQP